MSKILIATKSEYVKVYRDTRTGLALVEDYSTGSGHSCHPNIYANGSVRGMKKLGYWGKNDEAVRCRGFIYNISRCSVDNELDELARLFCQCGGYHGDR